MIKWKIWYGDGTFVTNETHDVADVPSGDVQCIVQRDLDVDEVFNVGRKVLRSEPLDRKNYYWYDDGDWYCGDIEGLIQYILKPGLKKILLGTIIRDKDFRTIIQKANEDTDFPPKSGYKAGEIKYGTE